MTFRKVNMMQVIQKRISDFLPPAFYSLWRAAMDPSKLNIVEKGGRGSGKSSDIAHVIVQLLMREPVNAVAIRAVENTVRLSVFEQLKWAIEEQGVSHLWKQTKNPMQLTYLPRGNYITFRGAQDPERIKSLKDSRFPFAIAWIEELAEFKKESDVTTITNSLLRGELPEGCHYKFFYSYNPPKRKQSWVNKKYNSSMLPDNTVVHHTTYLDNPFVAKEFKIEAEAAKKTNERRYRWEYMGETVGSGVEPFDNLKIIKNYITDDLLDTMDTFVNGLDFGFANDQLAFVRWAYDERHRTIYAVDELYKLQLSNRKCAQWLKCHGYQYQLIYCDSDEPKSIAELREYGISKARPAKKGPDSVEFGERWLEDLDAIIIDPVRTPSIAWEFENIDFATDRNGEPQARLEDKNNHTIDATRYAFYDIMRRAKVRVKAKPSYFRG